MFIKKHFCLFLIFQLHFVYLVTVSQIVEPQSIFNNEDYFNFYKIPSEIISFSSNIKEFSSNNTLFKAFDNNENTFWKSKSQHQQEYQEEGNNIYIISKFKKTVEIDRIIYKSINDDINEKFGYPLKLKVYYKLNENEDYNFIDEISSEPSRKRVLFTLKEKIKCNEIKLECSKIYKEEFVTANEISFLMPENKYITEEVIKNIFSPKDYKQKTLSKEYDNINLLNNLIDKSKDITNISKYGLDLLNKAKSIAIYNKNKQKSNLRNLDESFPEDDPRREFFSDQTVKTNKLKQVGNIDSYARNVIKMTFCGTNRQITGIVGKSGETIIIYVTGEDKDPLPSVLFTQFIGPWELWFYNSHKLKKGKNVLTFEDFDTSEYQIKTLAGGPIYLINPYTSEEQSQNVKVYIEGGDVFPIYRLGENIDNYKTELDKYQSNLSKYPNKYFDITELECNRAIITVPCSKAYDAYYINGKSPKDNLYKWNTYLKQLFEYDGIQFNPGQPYYNKINQYINIHIRYSQPYGEAYAYTEHLGIFYDHWIKVAIDSQDNIFDWGFPHEIGHMMDLPDRTIIEITNNMISKYSVTYLEKAFNWGMEFYDAKIPALLIDNEDDKLRGCTQNDIKLCKGFFSNLYYNYLIFWDLESYSPGYWGKLENMYRYNYDIAKKMTRTERFVYFSSIVLQMDLGYYFTRWGFFIENDMLFDDDFSKTTSDYFNEMENAKYLKIIDKKAKQRKFWYLDNNEYMYMIENGSGCYKDKTLYDIQIYSVQKNGNNYIIFLPNIDCEGHLGFEIYEHGKLIAFTYSNFYEDTNEYKSDYVPQYYIIAYDRLLDESNKSNIRSP